MSENLFAFPGGAPDAGGENPFDLGVFSELSGKDAENPFADLLEGTPAEKEPPAQDGQLFEAAEPGDDEASMLFPATPSDTSAAPEPEANQGDTPPAPKHESREEPDSGWRTESTEPEEDIPPAPAIPAIADTTAVQEPEANQAKTPPAPEAGSHEEPGDDAQEENPLLAAMTRQEEKNARRAAEPFFAQLPVFSYNGTEEPIEDTEQTFEELRLAKADDFPEFDEAQNLRWSVVYGKITKTVQLPRKTKIGQFKREIESSKDFINALKKATDKHPKCLVKPVVNMQKKGEASIYKGAFLSLEDARKSCKTITFIPARDGKVYERRATSAGEFITPTEPPADIAVLDRIRPGFHPSLPRIPYALMEQAIHLFRSLAKCGRRPPVEALVHFYWDKQEQRYFIYVPSQHVGPDYVEAVIDDETLLDSDRYIHFADLHSHNRMPAVFSKTDDRDERATRVYMVMGRLDRCFPEISVRISNGGRFWEISPEQVLEPPPAGQFPSEWLPKIQIGAPGRLEAAA